MPGNRKTKRSKQKRGGATGESQFASQLSHFSEGATCLADAGLERKPDGLGGTGLFAVRDLPKGFALSVPRQYILDSRAAAKTILGTHTHTHTNTHKQTHTNTYTHTQTHVHTHTHRFQVALIGSVHL